MSEQNGRRASTCQGKRTDGQPCGQIVGAKRALCIWHASTPEGRRAIAMKGGLSQMRVLAADTARPVLDTPEGVRSALADTLHALLTGTLDYRIASAAFAGLAVALKLAELEVAAQIGDLEKRFRLRRA